MEEVLTPTRRLIGGKFHSVHVSKDGAFEIDLGPDDQRPDHDGMRYFLPICVAKHLFDDNSVYDYHFYCGFCRKRMGGLGEMKKFCPHCGAGIAHYIFAMGIEHWRKTSWNEHLPERWDGGVSGCASDLGDAKPLSGDIAPVQKLLGNG